MNPLIGQALIGMVAGGLAGRILRGRGLGLIGNVILGVAGAFVGGWIDGQFNLVSQIGFLQTLGAWEGLAAQLVTATGGSIILLLIGGLVKRKR